MRRSGFVFFILLLIVSLPVQAQEKITLEDCIGKALEANYSIKMVRNQEKIAENNANYAPFLPTVALDAEQNQRLTDSKTRVGGEVNETSGLASDAYSAGVSLNWRLFDGMSMFTTYTKYQEMLAIGSSIRRCLWRIWL